MGALARFLVLALLDMAGPGLALGYAIGRIGCQVSGDGDYGRAWDGPWAMGYPTAPCPPPRRTVHPTPIYETLVMGLVACVLWQLRDRVRPGALFALYLVIAGTERFLIEFIRRNDDVALGLTAAQLESLSLFVIGAVWLAVVGRRGGCCATTRRGGAGARACRRPESGRAAGASGCGAGSAGGAGDDRAAARVGGGAGAGSGCGAALRRRGRARDRASASAAGAGGWTGPASAGCGVASVGGVGLSSASVARRAVDGRGGVVRGPSVGGVGRWGLGGRRRLRRRRRGRRLDGRAGGHVAVDRAGGRVAGLGHRLVRRGRCRRGSPSASPIRPNGPGRLAADT